MTKEEKQAYWESVDWSLPFDELAAATKASRPAITKWAKTLGKKVVRKKRTDSQGTRGITTQITDEEFLTKKDAELAKIHGVCRERIRQIRLSRGLPKSPKNHPEWAGIDFTQKTSAIMEKHGLSRQAIAYARKKLAITEFEYDSPTKKGVDISTIKNWNRPLTDIAKELGVSYPYAWRLRKKHVMTTLHEQV